MIKGVNIVIGALAADGDGAVPRIFAVRGGASGEALDKGMVLFQVSSCFEKN